MNRVLLILLLASCTEIVAEDGADDTFEPANAGFARVGQSARVVNTGGLGLRLRSGAGASFPVLLVMPEGATVNVIAGPSAGW